MTQDDPVVQRVREARRQIAAECDFDAHKLYLWAKEREAELVDRVVKFEPCRSASENANGVRDAT
ncbi:MAG: hypothetical protein HZA51_01670 [Planctomycetes bacterium]|nr:hypothetical protein [Planctomycetota bacterium]